MTQPSTYKRPAPVGFMVWCPERSLPTYVHDTFADALAEAERLKRGSPRNRFFVMAPVIDAGVVMLVSQFSRGLNEGRKEAYHDVVEADARADRARDELYELASKTKVLEPFRDRADDFQAIVADCLLWFDGFAAAQSGAEPWDRSRLPEREKIAALNAALQAVLRSRSAEDLDDQIPF